MVELYHEMMREYAALRAENERLLTCISEGKKVSFFLILLWVCSVRPDDPSVL